MPIFEYRCQDCGQIFEFYMKGKESAECPSCGSQNLKKLLSRFNSSVLGGSNGSGLCATCSGGSCSSCGK